MMNYLLRKAFKRGITRRCARYAWSVALAGVGFFGLTGCSSTLLFNPAFVNQTTGEVFPLTPKDRTNFVLVRVNNATTQSIEFVVTAERRVLSTTEPDTFTIETETHKLFTQPQQSANDLGVLFECPIVRVGLGEDLDRPNTEPGLFLNATAVGAGGFGIPSNTNPLDADAENFDCGDTIIFVASESASVAGGVVVTAFLLDDDGQPDTVAGLDTFGNARTLIETLQVDEE